jgi:hypothetical protein
VTPHRTNPYPGVTARDLLLVALPTLAVAALGPIPLLAWRYRLPDPLASHWGTSGGPDGSMSQGVLLGMNGAAVLIAFALMIWAVTLGRRRYPTAVAGMVLAGLVVCTITAAASLSVVAVNLDLADWRDAGTLPLWHMVLAVGPAIAVAGTAARTVAASTEPTGPGPGAGPEAVPLAPGEQAVWVQSMVNLWMLAPALLLAASGLVMLTLGSPRALGGGLVVVGLATSALASIRVTVDRRGLEVTYGPLHRPRTRIAVHRIASADVIEVHPSQWGGWGYRGSLRLMKRAAVVLRKGPGLHLRLRDGSEFAVTIPDPEPGAHLLNQMVATLGP